VTDDAVRHAGQTGDQRNAGICHPDLIDGRQRGFDQLLAAYGLHTDLGHLCISLGRPTVRKLTERRPVYFVLIERSINKEYYLRQFVAIDAGFPTHEWRKRHGKNTETPFCSELAREGLNDTVFRIRRGALGILTPARQHSTGSVF
jgi:hypothetical protein